MTRLPLNKFTPMPLLLTFSLIKSFGVSEFIEQPLDGNRLESRLLNLRWNHTFENVSGCFWNFISNSHRKETAFISYGEKEGLEILRSGWELADFSNECSGGILKRISSVSDSGTYEFGIIHDDKISKSERLTIGIIPSENRSVHILSPNGDITLIPDKNDNAVILVENTKYRVKLNDRYPRDTCTSIQTFRWNGTWGIKNRTIDTKDVCEKSFSLSFSDNDVTHIQLTIPVDAVDYKQFVFTIKVIGSYECAGNFYHTEKSVFEDVITKPRIVNGVKRINIPFAVSASLSAILFVALIVVLYLFKRQNKLQKKNAMQCYDDAML